MKILTYEEEHRLLLHLRWGSCVGVADYCEPLICAPTKNLWRKARNVAGALLMLDTGLRVGELVKLKGEHLYFHGQPVQMLYVPKSIAKRQNARELPMTSRVVESLKILNTAYHSMFHTTNDQLVFASKMYGQSMTTRQMERIIGDAAMTVLGRVITPHMLRHTYGTRLLKVTDTRTLQVLMGHKHLSSTQIYTHVNSDDCIEAVDAMQKRHLNSLDRRRIPQ